MRELPEINRKEMDAVREAIEETQTMRDGSERMRMIKMAFWSGKNTLDMIALRCHISYRTAIRWHSQFIKLVAKKFGFL